MRLTLWIYYTNYFAKYHTLFFSSNYLKLKKNIKKKKLLKITKVLGGTLSYFYDLFLDSELYGISLILTFNGM